MLLPMLFIPIYYSIYYYALVIITCDGVFCETVVFVPPTYYCVE